MQTNGKRKLINPTWTHSVMMKANEMFESFKERLPLESDERGEYCYVKTALGYLEVDLRSLIYLTAKGEALLGGNLAALPREGSKLARGGIL